MKPLIPVGIKFSVNPVRHTSTTVIARVLIAVPYPYYLPPSGYVSGSPMHPTHGQVFLLVDDNWLDSKMISYGTSFGFLTN